VGVGVGGCINIHHIYIHTHLEPDIGDEEELKKEAEVVHGS
jgi:hypothetical protein